MTIPPLAARTHRQDWAQQAIVAGFIATALAAIVLVVAFIVARAIGDTATNANVIVQWFYHLTHNAITTRTTDTLYGAILLHLAFGLLWAGVYAYYAEPAPALAGPAWRRGLIFAMGPWLLSITVFFWLLGAGFLGFGLNAGPLPIIGNLVLHAVYGVTLGVLYDLTPHGHADADGREIGPANRAEHHAGIGIAAGAVVGCVAGLGLGVLTSAGAAGDPITTGPWEFGLFGAVLGAVGGALVGSMAGLSDGSKPRS